MISMHDEPQLYFTPVSRGISLLAQFEGDEAVSLISYLFSVRWDHFTLVTGRFQRHGQF